VRARGQLCGGLCAGDGGSLCGARQRAWGRTVRTCGGVGETVLDEVQERRRPWRSAESRCKLLKPQPSAKAKLLSGVRAKARAGTRARASGGEGEGLPAALRSSPAPSG
jgi:hypothetical protein